MPTRVVHCKKEPFDVYIGRPGPWGNPFKIGGLITREQVIEQFKDWFNASDDKEAKWMREHIHELKGKTLGCWCSPQTCHGDILKKYADQS